MQTMIGVRFKKAGRIYSFSPGGLDIKAGDDVIVTTARGEELGKVVTGPKETDRDAQNLRPVERKATERDMAQAARNHEDEKRAFLICEEKIAARALPMKLVDVEYTFDVSRIVFYFTADGRVDFRELVKDLAAAFHTRIELRQIGVRDEAKLLGGIGCCGRPLCCATFLGDFVPVSIRMAKEQGLSLNPAKISGICGRLMCCLKYESDYPCDDCAKKYTPKKKVLPPSPGSRVVTTEGEGKAISINVQRRTATILLDDRKTVVASWEDVVEKEEDLAGIAAMAAIAMIQQEAEDQAPPASQTSHDKARVKKKKPREKKRDEKPYEHGARSSGGRQKKHDRKTPKERVENAKRGRSRGRYEYNYDEDE